MVRIYYTRVCGLSPSRQSEIGRILLQYALNKDYGITDATVARADGGKPYLKEEQSS